MSTAVRPAPRAQPKSSRRIAVALAGAIAVAVAAAVALWGLGTLPQFPPVAEASPEPAGLLAYRTPVDGDRCVTVAPVAGGDEVILECGDFLLHRWNDDGDVEVAAEQPFGPEEELGPEGGEALLVTSYDPLTGEQLGSPVEVGWQTWERFEIPGPEREQVQIDDRFAAARVVIEAPGGEERTVVDLDVPDGYRLWSIGRSPDGRWLYAEDSAERILLIDPNGVNDIWVIAEPGDGPTWYLEGEGSTTVW